MKIITANFLTCAVKTCKTSPSSFPLHFRDAELVQQEIDYNPLFLRNVLPRLDWGALKITAAEVCVCVYGLYPRCVFGSFRESLLTILPVCLSCSLASPLYRPRSLI
jgi:hypothetical protein